MKVLVVTKDSLVRRLKGLSAKVRKKLLENRRQNREATREILSELKRRGVSVEVRTRAQLRRVRRSCDLVVVVGGDGTFFGAGRFVGRTPVILVNSAPGTSLALFSSCTREGFGRLFDAWRSGRARETLLNRMRLSIPARRVDEWALNDILFAHRNPGSMTRYTLRAGGREEFQQSSGLWVSTAAGSTGSVMSAGGRMMSLASKRIQWVVREPYSHKGIYRMLRGTEGRLLEIVPESIECAVWVDGSKNMHEVGPGEGIRLRTPGLPLRLVGYSDRRRKDLFGRWISRHE
jgi:NAD+ kinase